MKIQCIIKRLEPKNPFRIARGEKLFVENVFIRIDDCGVVGYGEASPNKYYNESAEDVVKKLTALETYLSDKEVTTIKDIEKIWNDVWPYLQPLRAAQCCLDIALWDIVGKKAGLSVARLLWSKPSAAIVSSCTLSISEPAEWQDRVAEIAQCPVVKIKMDSRGDISFPEYVHSVTKAVIRVDANCSWGSLDAVALIHKLKAIGVEFVEQPLPPEENSAMRTLLAQSPLPILADESCTIPSLVPSMLGKFSGINIKLVKCGGLTPGLTMLTTAKRLNLKVMVGCMLESNLLIAAGAALAQQADYADLDGSWLLKDRVFEGVDFTNGIVTLSDNPGLGVSPKLISF